MTDRSPWLLALTTANFVFLAALAVGAFFVKDRLESVERKVDGLPASRVAAERGATRPADVPPKTAARRDGDAEPADDVTKRLQKLSDDLYDDYSDLANDLHQIKQTVKQTHVAVRRLKQTLAAPGQPTGEWNLAPINAPITPEILDIYRRGAAGWGVKIEDGRVEVDGFLNMSPWATMPIEYFVTRYPESGHETLLHVLGPARLSEDLASDRLKGLVTSIYQGMVVAGFKQGLPARLDPPPAGEPQGKARWSPPSGDPVYVGVRYELHGQVHVARATDWVLDPSTRSVLPEDAFRFTGALRQDDYESGDEQISAEAGGIVVSVYTNPNSLVEIALASNLENRYQYHHARIPKPASMRLKDGSTLDVVRDRARDSLTVHKIVRDGKRSSLEKAPVLLGRSPDGIEVEVPFAKAGDAWVVTHASLAKSEWRVRIDGADGPIESAGFEPVYVRLIFSKTPIVPEGDGSKPIEVVQFRDDVAGGTGKGPDGPQGPK